jgi:hypothetical protein
VRVHLGTTRFRGTSGAGQLPDRGVAPSRHGDLDANVEATQCPGGPLASTALVREGGAEVLGPGCGTPLAEVADREKSAAAAGRRRRAPRQAVFFYHCFLGRFIPGRIRVVHGARGSVPGPSSTARACRVPRPPGCGAQTASSLARSMRVS